jgi:prepilin-type processing-associated H-X9-DG protein
VNDPLPPTNPSPTRFPELNELLAELTERAAELLADNFVGAYLQGSFAVGDADIHSDCDFLIPVHGPITPDQEVGLRALHDEIPDRPGHWTQHLEGSYPNKDELRTLDGLGRPWLYIDHGWRAMQWSTHCNTEVVRWTLRECGVTLAGPDPEGLVDPVGPEILKARMREDARTFLPDLLAWISLDIAWAQRYAVTTLCRILQTFDEGRVTSKRAALLWADGHVDPEWSNLIRQVIDDRRLGWDPHEPPRPGSVEQTLAFVEYVQRRTGVDPVGR